MKCPKCDFDQPDGNVECQRCGLVFSKFEAIQKKKEQVNARYSPQARSTDDDEDVPESDEDGASPAAAEPAAEAPGALQAQEVKQLLQKLQLGVHSTLKFQESLADELQSQQGMIRQLFTQFSDLQAQLDQKVLAIQGQMQMVTRSQDELRQNLAHAGQFQELEEGLAGLEGKVDKLIASHKEPRWVREMKPRLEKLESTQTQLRKSTSKNAPERSADALAGQESMLLKSEVQALRSEVRNLLEQSITPPQSATTALPETAEDTLQELEKRLQQVLASISDQKDTFQKEQEKTRQELDSLQSRLQESESRLSSFSAQKEFWMGLTEEISHLQQSFQTFHDAIRSELAQQYQILQQSNQDLSDQQAAVAEIHLILQKIRQALHPE
jgi:chromosome segregation ATPase